MREIKFRAWNEEHREMVYFDLSSGLDDGCCFAGNHIIYEICEVPVMQFTGLKDKNGREIYEGDLIRDHDPKFLGVVEVINCRGGWACRPRLDWFGKPTVEPYIRTAYAFQQCPEYIERGLVIGNIYENPELL